MKNISFFKKVKLFFQWRKSLSQIKMDLSNEFNVRIDVASRLYTVLNIPQENFEEPYNIRKEDIDTISKRFIRDFSLKLSDFLNSRGLFELYRFYEVKKVDKYSYLIIFGFSLFNSSNFLKDVIIFFSTLIIISLFTSLIFMFF